MSTTASRFDAATTGEAKDRSPGKTIVTGDSGVGKTYFTSTITSEDGRPIFLIPVEEGLKGISPLHHPALFTDSAGSPIVPMSFQELLEALVAFKDTVNRPAPTQAWYEHLPYDVGSIERRVLGELISVYPQWLPRTVIANRTGAQPSALDTTLSVLADARRVELHAPSNSVRVIADRSWKRPYLHLGIDSLSGIEKLIHAEVTGRAGVKSMADKEYNKLWTEAQPLWSQVQNLLDIIRRQTGTHVWIVAHCIEDVDASATTSEIYRARDLMLKGTGKTLTEIRQFWRQWADSVWYIMRDVAVTQGTKTKRTTAQSRGRILITTETAQCKAKSRMSIPPRLPATWGDVKAALMALQPAPPDRLEARILALLDGLSDEERKAVRDEIAAAANAGAQRTAILAALLSRVEGLRLCADGEHVDDSIPEESEQAPANQAPPPMPPDTPEYPEQGI